MEAVPAPLSSAEKAETRRPMILAPQTIRVPSPLPCAKGHRVGVCARPRTGSAPETGKGDAPARLSCARAHPPTPSLASSEAPLSAYTCSRAAFRPFLGVPEKRVERPQGFPFGVARLARAPIHDLHARKSGTSRADNPIYVPADTSTVGGLPT